MITEDTQLTVNEVSLMYKRHPQTVRNAIKDGSLHGEQSSGERGHYRVQAGCAQAWNRGEKCEHYKTYALSLSRRRSA